MPNNIIRVSGGLVQRQSTDVEKFRKVAEAAAERKQAAHLIFGLDLTASREDTLEQARVATASMFDAIKNIGSLSMKLVYYRGGSECKASKWQDDPGVLANSMRALSCIGGSTQIARVLDHAIKEAEAEKIGAVVFVGDHCEESPDELIGLAQKLGNTSTPVFVFHECEDHDHTAQGAVATFKSIAEKSGGDYCQFNGNSGLVLQELLLNVAAFSTGGQNAIRQIGQPTTPEARRLQQRLLAIAPPK